MQFSSARARRTVCLGLPFATALMVAAAGPANAQSKTCTSPQGDIKTCNTPNKYQITIYEFGLCADSTCQSRTPLGASTKAFDFASVAPGAPVGDFVAANSPVTPGTYTHSYMIWGGTVVLRGRVTLNPGGGAARDCLTATNEPLDPGGGGDPIAKGEWAAPGTGSPRDISLDLIRGMQPGQSFSGEDGWVFRIVDATRFQASGPLPKAVVVAAGSKLGKITVSFDVAEGIGAYENSRDGGQTWECGIAIAAPTFSIKQD